MGKDKAGEKMSRQGDNQVSICGCPHLFVVEDRGRGVCCPVSIYTSSLSLKASTCNKTFYIWLVI